MGNFTSSSAKVIDAQGNLRKVELTAKAADLILDEPVHVIAPVEQLKRTRRVVAIRADDMNSCLRTRKSGGAMVLPDVEAEEESSVDRVLPVHGCRLGNYRPWTPVLEPISEVI
ncbi:hypothetical protein F3Y22_tig00116951pilonHSYRG00438 [Hibiscus syriacus]|uniref:Uncharacterized protein n=1 Tax=Hibiscus syriacus TaxID=106335 RepID=A0A6A2WLR4_HIBSY|nr:hypothetical protein F3Y22_tig00116951pilonHSYRG00438 [Hibiscus syriacus]